MKISFIAAVLCALATSSLAASVNVMSSPVETPLPADINVIGAATMSPAINQLRIGTMNALRGSTGLINKNTLAMDNNIFVSKSNLLFDQSDRLRLAHKIEALVTDNKEADVGVLSRNVLKAVSSPDTDAAMMNKASAVVVASKTGDQTTMQQSIADLVKAVMSSKQEQAIQAQSPTTLAFIGDKDILRQPSGVLNKNFALSDNQIAITRSQIAPTSNDRIFMTGGAKVADAILPGSSVLVNTKQKQEQAIQAQNPATLVFIGTKDVGRQSSGIINKNSVLSDNQITIARSQVAPTSNDVIAMTGGAQVARAIAPGSSVLLNKEK
jgi:hypothetical protein